MKAFAVVLLCAVAAVQGRYTALEGSSSAAALGENPWFVHLRIATNSSGMLITGAGTLISDRWVLTTAENLVRATFIWARYGVVNVINPSVVTESNQDSPRIHPAYNDRTGENNLGLISINRHIETTEFIAPISPLGEAFNSPATFCNFGENNGVPGEQLNCYTVGVGQKEDNLLVISNKEAQVSVSDSGAPLVANGQQIGILIDEGQGSAIFIKTRLYEDWINEVTGVSLNSEAAPEAVRFIE